MKKMLTLLAASLLALNAMAAGPGQDPSEYEVQVKADASQPEVPVVLLERSFPFDEFEGAHTAGLPLVLVGTIGTKDWACSEMKAHGQMLPQHQFKDLLLRVKGLAQNINREINRLAHKPLINQITWVGEKVLVAFNEPLAEDLRLGLHYLDGRFLGHVTATRRAGQLSIAVPRTNEVYYLTHTNGNGREMRYVVVVP